ITLIKKIKIETHFIGYHRRFRYGCVYNNREGGEKINKDGGNGEAKTITIDCIYHGVGYHAHDIRVDSDSVCI
ncbi:MAG: hypothetical protein J7J46_00925, partial [Candidatus Desulfofervidus sp.]|nr:hypothetical protein [Candidatus Desulfofervidus sp.]